MASGWYAFRATPFREITIMYFQRFFLFCYSVSACLEEALDKVLNIIVKCKLILNRISLATDNAIAFTIT